MIKARFKAQKSDFTLDINLELPATGVSAIYGPSGSGKTTVLRAIAGLDKYQNGYVNINNNIWQDADTFIPTHRRNIAYVFQEPALFTHLDVEKNLKFALGRRGESAIEFGKILQLLNLGHLLKRKVDNLSGGEKQRTAIGQALGTNPDLLLMDEPLSSLDVKRKREFLPYLEALNLELKIPLIYVSHALDEVARLADHVVLLEDGKVADFGKVEDVFTKVELPLAHDNEASAIINTTVLRHDEKYHLTYLEFPGGIISVARGNFNIGDKIRVQLAARDVSLTLAKQTDTSIINIFKARVDSITDETPSQVIVRLLAGGVPILSRITRKSQDNLNIRPGSELFVQVKSVALLS